MLMDQQNFSGKRLLKFSVLTRLLTHVEGRGGKEVGGEYIIRIHFLSRSIRILRSIILGFEMLSLSDVSGIK